MYQLKKILVKLSRGYALDARALSLMRISVALVIISDLIIRGGDLSAHYTDAGIWPTKLVHNFGWKTGFWSLHELSGAYGWELFLFALHFTFALLLLFGLRTKLATFVVWLLYISLHNRNVFIQQAGDDLLRLALFWGLFLPWGSYYSLDARRIKSQPKQKPLANVGYLLLIASVYIFTVFLKTSPEWRSDLTAVYYAMSLDQLRLPMGDWLYQHPTLMKALTAFVYYAELLIPLLILLPARKGYTRLAAFALIVILHAGIGATLYVGLFFVINMVTAIALLPAFAISWLENKIPSLSTSALWKAKIEKRSKPALKIFINAICILAICLSAVVNLSAVKWFRYELTNAMLVPVNAARLDQYWGMFSPSVLKRDGWYVYYGEDSLGRQWDLIRDADYVSFEKPERVVKIHSSDRWRKLTENMQTDRMDFLKPLFCKYILKRWNRKHPDKKMMTLKLYYMRKESLPDYKTTPVEKVLYCICNDR